MSLLYCQILHGADISAAGTEILTCLGFHPDNLLSSAVVPKPVDGHNITPLGCIPVTFCLQQQLYQDNLHFLPGVTGAIISWKAAKGLGILPYHYPSPAPTTSPAVQATITWSDGAKNAVAEEIMKEYPTVFDGQVRVMEGEVISYQASRECNPILCENMCHTLYIQGQVKSRTGLTTATGHHNASHRSHTVVCTNNCYP